MWVSRGTHTEARCFRIDDTIARHNADRVNRHIGMSIWHNATPQDATENRGNSARRLRVAFRLSLPDVSVGRYPAHKELIAERQNGGTDEHPQDSGGRHATHKLRHRETGPTPRANRNGHHC